MIKKFVIIGSSTFRKEKIKIRDELIGLGYGAIIDPVCESIANGKNPELAKRVEIEPSSVKKEYDFVRWYFEEIKKSDGVVVVNPNKKGMGGYIGANSFLEIGYAHALKKKIYLLYKIPNQEYINDELKSFNIIELNEDLSLIK